MALHVFLSIQRRTIDAIINTPDDEDVDLGFTGQGSSAFSGSAPEWHGGGAATGEEGKHWDRHPGARVADHGRRTHEHSGAHLEDHSRKHRAEHIQEKVKEVGGTTHDTGDGTIVPHTYGKWSPVSTKEFYNALRAKGFSPHAAAGLTGNAIWESGGDKNTIILNPPTGANSGSGARGAMQWEGEGKRGRSIGVKATLENQVQHIYDEISSGKQGLTMGQINRASSPEHASHMVNYLYERPLSPPASERQRATLSRGVYERFHSEETAVGDESNAE